MYSLNTSGHQLAYLSLSDLVIERQTFSFNILLHVTQKWMFRCSAWHVLKGNRLFIFFSGLTFVVHVNVGDFIRVLNQSSHTPTHTKRAAVDHTYILYLWTVWIHNLPVWHSGQKPKTHMIMLVLQQKSILTQWVEDPLSHLCSNQKSLFFIVFCTMLKLTLNCLKIIPSFFSRYLYSITYKNRKSKI